MDLICFVKKIVLIENGNPAERLVRKAMGLKHYAMIARLPKQDISFFKENPRLAGDILFLKGGNKNPSSEGL